MPVTRSRADGDLALLQGGLTYGRQDRRVARAAAQVAIEPATNGCLIGTRRLVEQRDDRQDHPRSAKAALERAAAYKGLLHAMESIVGR
jgi:hypothetical protein